VRTRAARRKFGNERYRAVCPTCFYSEFADPVRAPGLFG
jgi:thymidine kinase